jgi:DNA-binding LacI/PurR family transcriptional regulator
MGRTLFRKAKLGGKTTKTRAKMSIVDVARIAEVSTATVSRVLNAPGSVRAETADRVHAAMQRLGFSLPTVRRGPKIGPRAPGARPNQIAVIVVGKSLRWFEQPAMGGILAGITSAARQAKMRVLLEESDSSHCDIPRLLQNRSAAGAILLADPASSKTLFERCDNHVPLVWIANCPALASTVKVEQVWADDAAIGCMAYQQLADLGCRQLFCLCDQPEYEPMRRRAQAFAHAAAEDSRLVHFILRRRDALVLDSFGSHTSIGDSLDELARILAGEITSETKAGVFLPTDLLAAQIYPLLYQNKITPGHDLTVATVANEYLRRAALIPEPISIDIGSEAIGRTALERLLRRIANPAEPAKCTLVAPSLDGQRDS